MDFGGDNNAPN